MIFLRAFLTLFLIALAAPASAADIVGFWRQVEPATPAGYAYYAGPDGRWTGYVGGVAASFGTYAPGNAPGEFHWRRSDGKTWRTVFVDFAPKVRQTATIPETGYAARYVWIGPTPPSPADLAEEAAAAQAAYQARLAALTMQSAISDRLSHVMEGMAHDIARDRGRWIWEDDRPPSAFSSPAKRDMTDQKSR